ncbi:serine hydrolase [Henriciella sp.]|uniref:serine hydrolase domain-containing protein n=1 Tax=Henriciella sp. TaxID=1968823 RepID=UPI0026389EAF|nr:serine hydrolase domain-containing protein [Henriciella sp.]
MFRSLGMSLFTAALALQAAAQPVDETWLDENVSALQETHNLFALGAAVATVGQAPVVAVSGVTAKGSETPVDASNAWHIGSNTKALTALLYARLVEDGLAEWGATLAELFPELAEDMDPSWQDTTIEDLFAHRSGLGQVGPVWLISRRSDSAALPDQRYETTRDRLTSPPKGEPGAFEYSNLNYIVAGAAIERLLEISWEKAIRAYIFEAEESKWREGWGFGPPQDGLEGHKQSLFGSRTASGAGAGADNPQALGPAGTLHARMESHARLLLEFINEDSAFITPAMREHLLSTWPDDTASYAMGWGVTENESLGRVYGHNGSNTMWLSSVELAPEAEAVIIVNATEYTDASREAVRELMDRIEEHLQPVE